MNSGITRGSSLDTDCAAGKISFTVCTHSLVWRLAFGTNSIFCDGRCTSIKATKIYAKGLMQQIDVWSRFTVDPTNRRLNPA